MDSSDLFSHRQEAQITAPDPAAHKPVQPPVFSDQPQPSRPGDSPST